MCTKTLPAYRRNDMGPGKGRAYAYVWYRYQEIPEGD